MLVWRITLGAGIIAALSGLCWLDYQANSPGAWLFPLALLLAWMAAYELTDLITTDRWCPSRRVICLGTVLVVASNVVPLYYKTPACPIGPLGWPLVGLAVGLVFTFLDQLRKFREPGTATTTVALSTLAMVYVGVLLSFLVQLRVVVPNGWGLVAVVSLIVVVKLGDIGAYFVGRTLGRHKMAPLLSPGKTWEGAAGGLLFSCLGSWLVLELLVPNLQLSGANPGGWTWILYGVCLGGAGICGDLTESLLKRDAQKKDSSGWLPGLGGVLDMLDSLLLAAPVAYAFWLTGLVGP